MEKTQEMKEQEINLSLELLKKAIKRGVITYEHANPLEQNCYISSSDIIGVYFPNTKLKALNHVSYDPFALCSIGGVLYLAFSLKDDASDFARNHLDSYIFEDLEVLAYGRELLEIKKEIKRNIKEYENILTVLEKIKAERKKDGTPFKNALQNFSGVNMSFEFDIYGDVSSIRINWGAATLYRDQEERETHGTPTHTEIEKLIKEKKESIRKYLEEETKLFKDIDKIFFTFEKLVKPIKQLRKELDERNISIWYMLENQLKYMLLK